jgi:NDP-sugar pyrophosphorylase family protein
MGTVRHAVLLAAGRGTRMKELTAETPKPMLPILGRPLLEHILTALRSAAIDRFVIITGYQAERIEEHFGDGSRFGVGVCYRRQVVQDGTARALLLGREGVGRNPFLLGWGDILTDPKNYMGLVSTFGATKPGGVLSVNWVEDPCRGAAVYVDAENRIERIVEKPPAGTSKTHWLNSGIGVFEPVIFDYAEKVRPSPRGEYEIPDAIAAMIGDGLTLRAYPLEGFWSDVGTPEDLARAEELLGGGTSAV